MFNTFLYRPSTIETLEQSFSKERMAIYVHEARGNKQRAFQLYAWNSAIASTIAICLQGLEITLRNKCNEALVRNHGNRWLFNLPLRGNDSQQIARAIETLRKQNKEVAPASLIPELSFGFWISLLRPTYTHTLWNKALRHAFSRKKLSPKAIYPPFNHLRILRNRIAHHEPILKRHLEKNYDNINEKLEWLCTETAQWVAHHNSFHEIMKSRPN
ncbi:MAG: hypothetical protein AAFY76_07885 [Cyanobacteria bacterium J06649_11]